MSIKRVMTVLAVAVCLVASVAHADVDKVNGLLKDLGGGDMRSLTKAAKELGDFDISSLADAALSDSGIVEKLADLGANADRDVVKKAVDRAMEKLGPEFGNRIQGALDDPEMASKLFASIGDLGDKGAGAIDGLLGVVGDGGLDPGMRTEAIGALGDIGSKGSGGAVEEALEKASGDSNADVAGAAKKALGKIG